MSASVYYVVTRAHGVYTKTHGGRERLVFESAMLGDDETVVVNSEFLRKGYNIRRKDRDAFDLEALRVPIAGLAARGVNPRAFIPCNDAPPRLADALRSASEILGGSGKSWVRSMRTVLDAAGAAPACESTDRLRAAIAAAHPEIGGADDVHCVDALDEMQVIRIDFQALCGATGPPVRVFLNSGQHAREWLSQECLLQTLYLLLHHYTAASLMDSDARAAHPLAHLVFTVVPVVNVVGFYASVITNAGARPRIILTHDLDTSDTQYPHRMQRKPGQRTADLNRNYDCVHGLACGASTNPAAENFCGPFPESAVEVRAISQLLRLPDFRADLACDMHSFSDVVLLFPSFNLAREASRLAYGKARDYPRHMDNYLSSDFLRDDPAARARLEELAALGRDPGTPRSEALKREVAFLALFHYGPRAQLSKDITDLFVRHLPYFSGDPAGGLSYEATGVASDMYYKLGMMLCGLEIGDKHSFFAKDSHQGLAHQLNFPGQFLHFFASPELIGAVERLRVLNGQGSDYLPLHVTQSWQKGVL